MSIEPPLEIDNQWAVIIAAGATLVTAIGGLVLAFSVLIPTLRASKVALVKVAEVHQLVNSQRDALLLYQSALVGALRDNDVVVPPDPALRPVVAHRYRPESPPNSPPVALQPEQERNG